MLWRQVTCAELACVREEWPYPTPPGVRNDDAAAVALVGITAQLGLFGRAGLKAGEAVFVNVGAGDVGSMVLQMAKAVGVRAIATVGSSENSSAYTNITALKDLLRNTGKQKS